MGVHDTDKYAQIRELLGIPEDEPIFILRAQDRLSTPTIQRYVNMAHQIDPTRERPVPFENEWFEELATVIETFAGWQRNNNESLKLPD